MSRKTTELFREDAYLGKTEASIIGVTEEGIILDRTVFFAAGGGQPGDTGILKARSGDEVAVVDTQKGVGGITHRVEEGGGLSEGAAVEAVLDWPRRHRLMRMHSCLHLLCQAVDGNVTGGQIADGKGRLDFDVDPASIDKDAIGEAINRWITEDHPIRHFWIEEDELESRPELVRTIAVRPPADGGKIRLVQIGDIDLQACGGTHVRSTAEIGPVRLAKVENKGKRNRRFTVLLDE
ncbi:MAG: alanyl-tRNA editing protein [Geminicoccaceae bacterium]